MEPQGVPNLPRRGLSGKARQAPRERQPHANGRADAAMARLASGALRDQRSDGNPGRVPMPSRDGDRRAKPAAPHAVAGRWPRSRFAGNRARTPGALIYTASEALPDARAPSLHHLRNRDVRGQGGRVSYCKAYAKWMIARKLRAVFSSNVDAGSRVDASSARGRPGTTLRRR